MLLTASQQNNHRRIDLHHHFFPPSLSKAAKSQSVGWRTPAENLPWSPENSLKAMDALGIETAILSLPASSTGIVGPENRSTAREHNLFAAKVCKDYPGRFGFFATLPFLDDTKGSRRFTGLCVIQTFRDIVLLGALHEIAYALDELKADGVALTSSYGDGADASTEFSFISILGLIVFYIQNTLGMTYMTPSGTN
jgi:hypothetical protein